MPPALVVPVEIRLTAEQVMAAAALAAEAHKVGNIPRPAIEDYIRFLCRAVVNTATDPARSG